MSPSEAPNRPGEAATAVAGEEDGPGLEPGTGTDCTVCEGCTGVAGTLIRGPSEERLARGVRARMQRAGRRVCKPREGANDPADDGATGVANATKAGAITSSVDRGGSVGRGGTERKVCKCGQREWEKEADEMQADRQGGRRKRKLTVLYGWIGWDITGVRGSNVRRMGETRWSEGREVMLEYTQNGAWVRS